MGTCRRQNLACDGCASCSQVRPNCRYSHGATLGVPQRHAPARERACRLAPPHPAPESVKQRAAASSACDSRCRLPALAVGFSSPMPAGLPAAAWFGCPAACSLQPPAKWMSALSLHLASGGPHLQDARSAIPCGPRQQDVRSVGCRYVGLYVDFGCRRAGTVRDEACSLLYRTSISILYSALRL